MQDIHEIRPPVQVGVDPMLIKMILMGLGTFLVLLLIAFMIRKWRKNRGQSKELTLLPVPLKPYAEALQTLEELSCKPIIEPRMFYFDLTMVLRKYMGRSFGTHAIEMTSQEFLFSIRKTDIEDKIKMQLVEFYKNCDPYKYAGIIAHADQVASDIVLLRQMVTQVEKQVENQKENQLKTDQNIQKGES